MKSPSDPNLYCNYLLIFHHLTWSHIHHLTDEGQSLSPIERITEVVAQQMSSQMLMFLL
jgi:hypothetical protein